MDNLLTTVTGVVTESPAVVVLLPVMLLGAAVCALLGMKDAILLVVAAPPVAVSALALSAQALSWAGVSATPWLLVAVPLAAIGTVGLVAGLVRRRRSRAAEEPDQRGAPWQVWVGGALGAAIAVAVWLPGIGDIGLPPQQNDDIWHGYLVERLTHLQALGASDVAPVLTWRDTPTSYYPYGMHLLLSLGGAITGSSVPLVMNGAWVLIVGCITPFAVAALANEIFSGRPWVAVWAGLASPLPSTWYLMNGVMPYAIAAAQLPALLLLVLVRIRRPHQVPAGVLALGAAGLFLLHPAAAAAWAIASVGLVVESIIRTEGGRPWVPLLRLAVPGIAAGVLIVPWVAAIPANSSGVIGGGEAATWSGAARMALTSATPWTPSQPVLAVLVWVGIGMACVVLRRGIWLVMAVAVFGVLFVGVLAGSDTLTSWTGAWYGQWYRLVGVLGPLMAILAGLGVEGIRELLAGLTRRMRWSPRRGAVVVAVLLVLLTGAFARYALRAQSIVTTSWQGRQLVTKSDVALFDRLRSLAGPDRPVLQYWGDGSTWAYAISQVQPLVPYQATVETVAWAGNVIVPPEALSTTPGACDVLLRRDVRYALAKNRTQEGGSPYAAGLAATDELFDPVFDSAAGTIYELDRAALEQCSETS